MVYQRIPITATSGGWLDIVDARPKGEKAKWADNTIIMRRMLADNAIDCVKNANITKFKDALIAWFDMHTIINEVKNANLALEILKQEKDKDLRS